MSTLTNSVHITGNLVADPDLRFTTGGRAVANFRVAVNHRYLQNGEWVDRPSYFTCVAWTTLAENVANSLRKGDRVTVTGRLESRDWDDEQNRRHFVVEIICASVAPDLRFATVDDHGLVKNAKPDAPAAREGEREHVLTGVRQSDDPVYGDEEPF